MAQRIAKVAQEYAGRRIKPGETFEVQEIHVRLLEAIGRIEPVARAAEGAPPTTGAASTTTREMRPGPAASYQTRDMAAAPKKTRHREPIVGNSRKAS